MAILNGLIRKMNGSAGQLTFKQVNGMTIVSEKMTSIKNLSFPDFSLQFLVIIKLALLTSF